MEDRAGSASDRHHVVVSDGLTLLSSSSGRVVFAEDDCVVVFLRAGEKFAFWGHCSVEVEEGSATLSGAALAVGETYYVCAPRTHAAVSLCSESDAVAVSEDDVPASLKRLLSHRSDVRNVTCVVSVRPLSLQQFGLSTSAMFLNQSEESERAWITVCTAESGFACEVFPTQWKNVVIEHARAGSRVIVVGNRGVGKSSFIRFAVNTLLSFFPKVCVVDSDPGQPELGPPGTITAAFASSLMLSPGLYDSHSALEIISSRMVAGYSPDVDPVRFSSDVGVLCQTLNARLVGEDADVPVIFNTPGWVTGFGYDCLLSTVMSFRPTCAIQIGSVPRSVKGDGVISFGSAQTFPIIPLPSAASSAFALTVPSHLPPSGLRDIALSTYFSQASFFHTIEVFKVCLAFHEGHRIAEDLALCALSCTVVGLLSAPSCAALGGTMLDALPIDGELICLAFVRGVSADGMRLTLQCPISDLPATFNVVARAGHDTPSLLLSGRLGAYEKTVFHTVGLGRSAMASRLVLRKRDRDGNQDGNNA